MIEYIDSDNRVLHAAYFTYSNGRVISTHPKAAFWDLTKSIGLFRFKSDDDVENRKAIKEELLRRTQVCTQKANEYSQKAKKYFRMANNL